MSWDDGLPGRDDYLRQRAELAAHPQAIMDAEKSTAALLTDVIVSAAPDIQRDFDHASLIRSHWWHNAPKQRGRAPSGAAVPWLEVGEYSTIPHLLLGIATAVPNVEFPGLPTGGDMRFADKDRFVHLDIKATGPNDRDDEVVVPPYQVSGDGTQADANGVRNSILKFKGRRGGRARSYEFYPALPPFYLYGDKCRLTMTFFLKTVYEVPQYGIQPLASFELICVPNGLLLFDGPLYHRIPGLFAPGKDDRKKDIENRRVRVMFDPLAAIDSWRAVKISQVNGKWIARDRVP